jgi:hypothetical protein
MMMMGVLATPSSRRSAIRRAGSRHGAAGHFLYRKPRGAIPGVVDLRKFGINADLKHGNVIAVAPPSLHATGHVYAWDGCGPEVLRELPPFRLDALQRLLEKRPARTQDERKAAAGFPNGSRELALNAFLCKHAAWCDEQEEVRDLAREWNERLAEMLIDKIDDADAIRIADQVWRDVQAGKIERWQRHAAVARTNDAELQNLLGRGKFGPYAFAMLQKLRVSHGARYRRGETFAITPKAMAAAGTLPGV